MVLPASNTSRTAPPMNSLRTAFVPIVLPFVIPFWTSYPPFEDVRLMIKAADHGLPFRRVSTTFTIRLKRGERPASHPQATAAAQS